MSKKVKIIVILAITALVIGMLIYFYNKKKKSTVAEKSAAKNESKPEPAKPNPVIVKKLEDLQASGGIKAAEMPISVMPKGMSTN